MFLVVVIALLIILVVLLTSGSPSDGGVDDDTGQEEGVVDVTEDTYTNEDGYTVTQEIKTYADGGKVITETKVDEYGNVTTVDPSLITTYFPHQVMRQHTSKDLVDAGFEYTLRYSLQLDEDAKAITATIEYCDEGGNKALVQEYLSAIPLDLSEYTVNYETFTEDAFCE